MEGFVKAELLRTPEEERRKPTKSPSPLPPLPFFPGEGAGGQCLALVMAEEEEEERLSPLLFPLLFPYSPTIVPSVALLRGGETRTFTDY